MNLASNIDDRLGGIEKSLKSVRQVISDSEDWEGVISQLSDALSELAGVLDTISTYFSVMQMDTCLACSQGLRRDLLFEQGKDVAWQHGSE